LGERKTRRHTRLLGWPSTRQPKWQITQPIETPQSLRFKLGKGLTDAQRENPPAVGQWVTYRYRGLTDKGVPRFASFERIRPAIER
jgi:hypothetical protein